MVSTILPKEETESFGFISYKFSSYADKFPQITALISSAQFKKVTHVQMGLLLNTNKNNNFFNVNSKCLIRH